MITWRKEINGDWFGEGIRYQYAAQRVVSRFPDEVHWEVWRKDRTNPIASWTRTEPLIPYDDAVKAMSWADALERTNR